MQPKIYSEAWPGGHGTELEGTRSEFECLHTALRLVAERKFQTVASRGNGVSAQAVRASYGRTIEITRGAIDSVEGADTVATARYPQDEGRLGQAVSIAASAAREFELVSGLSSPLLPCVVRLEESFRGFDAQQVVAQLSTTPSAGIPN